MRVHGLLSYPSLRAALRGVGFGERALGALDDDARMDSFGAASLASALPELPPQPGVLNLLRSNQGATPRVPPARGRAQQCSTSETNDNHQQ